MIMAGLQWNASACWEVSSELKKETPFLSPSFGADHFSRTVARLTTFTLPRFRCHFPFFGPLLVHHKKPLFVHLVAKLTFSLPYFNKLLLLVYSIAFHNFYSAYFVPNILLVYIIVICYRFYFR